MDLLAHLPPEASWLVHYIAATLLVNLLFTRFTNQQLANAVLVLRPFAWLVLACRRLGFDPVPWLISGVQLVRSWAVRVTRKDDDQDPPAGSTPMQPPADRQATLPPRPTGMHRSPWVGQFGALLVALMAVGCPYRPDAKSPALETAAAGVVFAAQVMAKVDTTCGRAIDMAVEAHELTVAEDIHQECSRVISHTVKVIEAAALAIDGGKAAFQGEATCAVIRTYAAVTSLAPMLAKRGWTLGPGVDQFMMFAQPFLGMAERTTCHD